MIVDRIKIIIRLHLEGKQEFSAKCRYKFHLKGHYFSPFWQSQYTKGLLYFMASTISKIVSIDGGHSHPKALLRWPYNFGIGHLHPWILYSKTFTLTKAPLKYEQFMF